jgi:hypothetical protein
MTELDSMVSNLVILGILAATMVVALVTIVVRQHRRLRDLDSQVRRAGSERPQAPQFEPRF